MPTNDSNVFANFDRVAESLQLDRKQVLLVYALKHWDGIVSYVGGHVSQREDVRGRIKDLRMYLSLLWGMIEEESNDLTFNTVSVAGSTITTAIDRRTHSDCGRVNCTGCPECEG